MNELTENQIVELLHKTEFFSFLQENEGHIIASLSETVFYPAGSLVFDENTTYNQMYIVENGAILITKILEDEEGVDLAQYDPGDTFGELNLIGERKDEASAVAINDTNLVMFPQKEISFKNIMDQYPEIAARIMFNMITLITVRTRQTHEIIEDKFQWVNALEKQIYVDKLTGLYNKTYLTENVQTLFSDSGTGTNILMVKPDNFKYLNDEFGHDAGDKALFLISIFIQSTIRNMDIAIRYKGDEFAIIMPGASKDDGIEIARELAQTIYDMDISQITGGKYFKMKVSIGIANYPYHEDESMSIIELAYNKMFRARNRGGNRVIV
jgi:diguanylate cyclase (GGDEF)-like protein